MNLRFFKMLGKVIIILVCSSCRISLFWYPQYNITTNMWNRTIQLQHIGFYSSGSLKDVYGALKVMPDSSEIGQFSSSVIRSMEELYMISKSCADSHRLYLYIQYPMLMKCILSNTTVNLEMPINEFICYCCDTTYTYLKTLCMHGRVKKIAQNTDQAS